MKEDRKAKAGSALAALRATLDDSHGEAHTALTRAIAFIEALDKAFDDYDTALPARPIDTLESRAYLANAHLGFLRAASKALTDVGNDSIERDMEERLRSLLSSQSSVDIYGTNAHLPELVLHAYTQDLSLPDDFVGPRDSRMDRALALISLIRTGRVDRGDSVRNAVARVRKTASAAEYFVYDSETGKFTADPVAKALNALPGKRGRPKKAK